jgi:CspA family cold shock protein
MRTLRENQRIGYDLQQDNRGKMSAVNLKSAEESTAPEGETAEQPAEGAESADEA